MPSTPKHLQIYDAFGWQPPIFSHVGLLQDSMGNKLSKRSGDVHVSAYRDLGYLPETLINFVALLGWRSNSKSDLMTLNEMIQAVGTDDSRSMS